MPDVLEYARRPGLGKSWAVAALAVSLCSGPAALALDGASSANQLPESTKAALEFAVLVAVLGGAFAFACVVRFLLPASSPTRARTMANVAVVASIAWAVALAALLFAALNGT